MSWPSLAHKEFDELIRSRGVWLFGAVLLIGYYLSLNPSATVVKAAVGSNVTIGAFQGPVGFLVPIAAFVLSYRSIIGERESGSIKFVAGMPQSRSVVVLGKALGRWAALSVCVFGVFVVGAVIGATRYGLFSPLKLLLFFLASALYVLVNVSIATALSAATVRSRRALATLVACYFLLVLFWSGTVSGQIYTLLTGVDVPAYNPPASTGLFLWRRLSPISSYYVLTNAILGIANADALYNFVVIQLAPTQSINHTFVVRQVFDRPVPFYLAKWFSMVILAAWVVGSLFLGAVRFERADLASGPANSRSKIQTWIGGRFEWLPSMNVLRTARQRLGIPRSVPDQSRSHGSEHSSVDNGRRGRFTRWLPLARKELAATLRYRSLWVFAVLLLVGAYLTSTPPEYAVAALGGDVSIAAFQIPIWLFLPFIAAIVSYRSLSAEQESGSIKFVAGMPQSRGDVIVAKIVGRTAAVGVFVLGSMCVFILVRTSTYGFVSPVTFVLFAFVSLCYIAVNISLATGISAAMNRSVRAATAVFGYLIVLNPYLWRLVALLISRRFSSTPVAPAGGEPPPNDILFLLRRISPFDSYTTLTNTVLGIANSDEAYFTVLRGLQPDSTPGYIVGEIFMPPIPFYLSEWFPLLIFLGWTLVSVVGGYVAFQRRDLG